MAKKQSKENTKRIKALCKNIDKLRIDRGLSMREFADICDINKNQVDALSKAGIDFRYSTLLKIADGLEIGVSELLDFKA